MVALVSLPRVKQALRIGEWDAGDSPAAPFEDDDLLEAYILAASTAVIRYLKAQAPEVIPGLADSPPTADGCPETVEMAVIYLVGHFYREPDGNTDDAFDRGYLPKPVTALLYSYRDPALA